MKHSSNSQTGFRVMTIVGIVSVLALVALAFAASANLIGKAVITIAALACAILAIFALISIGFVYIRRTSSLLSGIQKSAEIMAQGEITSADTNFGDASEAAKQISGSVGEMGAYLSTVIADIKEVLYNIAHKGDFTTQTNAEYKGDFAYIKASIDELTESLVDVFTKIVNVSGMVLSGAEQLAEGNTELANGATQQAADSQELFSLITALAEGFNKSAQHALDANSCTTMVNTSVGTCKQQMEDVSLAMTHISESSAKIDQIIKTIDQIAFQTNILALNAAVEAARAGEAGKGFAVVADEVRMLANNTAEAAKETTQLIQESLDAIENGIQAVAHMETTIASASGEAEKSTIAVNEIAGEMDGFVSEIDRMKEYMGSVVSIGERNAGIAENSQASCEELYAQVGELDALVRRVKIS